MPYVTVWVTRHDGAATSAQVREAGIAKLEAQGGVTLDRGEAPLDRGLRELAAMRMDDGTFRYFADVPEAAG
ncbi:MAG: hypothetical protein FJ296_08835, partial [Planctomycetes bacterium]|nr:hypothetical protein [Planctomycetota bacterium]